VTIDRPDGNQAIEKLTMHLPTGLAAKLASVTPCPEPQPANNTCGSESLIGHATEEAGLGGNPTTLTAPVYFTGPYKGSPFGLSVVTHAKSGPFDLGLITVRSRIDVNPYTAAVTITSDPLTDDHQRRAGPAQTPQRDGRRTQSGLPVQPRPTATR